MRVIANLTFDLSDESLQEKYYDRYYNDYEFRWGNEYITSSATKDGFRNNLVAWLKEQGYEVTIV